MTLVDVDVLPYSYNADGPEHAAAAAWLEQRLAAHEAIALSLPVIWGFLRISTNRRLWHNPRSAAEVFAILSDLLAQPDVFLAQPGPRHLDLLRSLVTDYHATGPLVTDAVLPRLPSRTGR